MPADTDVGLLLLRLMAGLLIAGHGAQKLLGWWGGSSIERWAADLDKMGIRPGRPWAIISVGTQFVGGLLLAVGFLTPFATVSLVGSMVVAVIQRWPKGFWNVRGGYEFQLTLLVIAFAIALTGPGSVSIDALIGFHLELPIRVGIVLVTTAGALVAVLPARSAEAAPR